MSNTIILGVAILVFVVAAIGAWLLQRNHADLESTSIRILVFGLYFWLLVFAQGLIGGLTSLVFR